MIKKKLGRKNKRRILAFALSAIMIGGMLDNPMLGNDKVHAEEATDALISEDFETTTDDTFIGYVMGSPTRSLSNDSHSGDKALSITSRTADWNAYSYNISDLAEKTIKVNAFMRVADSDKTLVACLKNTPEGETTSTYNWIATGTSVAGEYVELTGVTYVPSGTSELYFQTPGTEDYLLDDVIITETAQISENFNDYESTDSVKGTTFGTPALTLTEAGINASKALTVSNRTQGYFGYQYNLKDFVGNKVKVSAQVTATSGTAISATLHTTKDGEGDGFNQVASATVETTDEFVKLTGEYDLPADLDTCFVYFEAPEGVDYTIDDICIDIVGDYKKPGAATYVDTSSYLKLKEVYGDDFKFGCACEAISNFNKPLSEIGNPTKEAFLKSQFNSITFGNELKPAYNMDVTNKTGERTETKLPFSINPGAKEMLDWAKDNNMPVRGHVLVWHSQCADEAFCVNYTPVYVDPNADNKVLDPSCFVDRATMLKRMESYIDSVMDYMYKNGYGTTIYAWDVVNEAINLGTNEYGLRESYWYKTIGPDYVYYAFKYAREAVEKYSEMYASNYGIDSENTEAVKSIQPKLFYNDFNEFVPAVRAAIINLVTSEINGHSIKEDGYIDGIGMQGHLSDAADIDAYCESLSMYNEAVGEVHITELDVTQSNTKSVNADYYQAVFYQRLFSALLAKKAAGVNLTNVTIWGLTDDNSWKMEGCPLLFKGNLAKKLAFDGVVNAKTGGTLPEPAYEAPDFKDINITFDEAEATASSVGFSPRGGGSLTIQSDEVFSGTSALLDSGRTQNWNGASFDVSNFAGQTIAISAWVKSTGSYVRLSADIDGVWPNIASCDTSDGEWKQLIGTYKIPSDLKGLSLYFEAEDLNDFYVDNVEVKLVGLDEDFEETTNITSPRGVAHMPVTNVVNTESRNTEGHSLLVTRQEQDASMKFDVSKYIGRTIDVTAYVKTNDSKIMIGFDGDTPIQLAEVASHPGEWTEVTCKYTISGLLTAASMYIETNGNSDFYIDDISIRLGEYVDDVEGNDLNFKPRWGGAGDVSAVEDGANNHVACITQRNNSYEGIAFDVSQFLGMEVEISFDVKSEASTVTLSGDIDGLWPNYLRTSIVPNQYNSVKAVAQLPSNLQALNLYIETEGLYDIYVDNLRIKRVPIGTEYNVTFDTNGRGSVSDKVAKEGMLLARPTDPTAENDTFVNWYKDRAFNEVFDFCKDVITKNTTLYAKWESDSNNPSSPSNPTDSSNPSNPNKPEEPSKPEEPATPSEKIETKKATTLVFNEDQMKDASVSATDVTSALSTKKDVVIEVKDSDGKVSYSVTFNKNNYKKDTKFDSDINIAVEKNDVAQYGYENGSAITFGKDDVKLPMQVTAKVNVSNEFKAGDNAYLYIYNADTKKLDCVPNSKYKVSKDGYVELAVIKSAEYVLLPKPASNNEKTSVINQIVVKAKSNKVSKGSKTSIKVTLPDTVELVSNLKKFNSKDNKAVYAAEITYKSSNKAIATVDKNGVVKAKKKGTVEITIVIKMSNGSKKTFKEKITVK